MTAAKAGNMAEVQKLVNTAGVNVNHTEWVRVLHLIYNIHVLCVTVLNILQNGDSPILAASNYGYSEIVQLLAQKGANVNSADKVEVKM
jgi:hypothetical protein